ncbi:hypothetical protein Q9L58_000218 [Maublancomyces gigas]|uniref:HNH nuclease domain-containing protein n=1 Tax=Discina gigas TaxID=1032678 RepID=A0ABR3GXF1_9PEZI
MLDIVLIATTPIRVSAKDTERVISTADTRLDAGDYTVSCKGEIHHSNEPWVHRIISRNVSSPSDAFRTGIRSRDGKCVISGIVNRNAPYRWTSWEAAHIFPPEKGRSPWVDSLENGVLLRSEIHQLFNQYLVSVNPDMGDFSILQIHTVYPISF